MIFLAWTVTTGMGIVGMEKIITVWENPRGNSTYQQICEHSFRHQMGQQIKKKKTQYSAWAEFWLPRRYAGRVAALQQLAESAASPRKTKTTQTLSLIYREQERSVWTWYKLYFSLKQKGTWALFYISCICAFSSGLIVFLD